MWRSTVQKFSSGGSGSDPSFSETEKVRVVGVDQIRQRSRMKRMENRADVESAQSEVLLGLGRSLPLPVGPYLSLPLSVGPYSLSFSPFA